MGPGNREREKSIGTGRSRMSGSHLNILDSVPISIIITLVSHAVIISIFLPRVRCQKAVVLKVKAGDGWMSSGLPQPGHPPCSRARLQLHLLAVLVVVHARQRLIRVAINVCVRPTHVPIPGPAHVTLGQHKKW